MFDAIKSESTLATNATPVVKGLHQIFDMIKLKASEDDKLNVVRMTTFLFDRVENKVGKGKMLVISIFSFFYKCFQKSSLSLKVWVVL